MLRRRRQTFRAVAQIYMLQFRNSVVIIPKMDYFELLFLFFLLFYVFTAASRNNYKNAARSVEHNQIYANSRGRWMQIASEGCCCSASEILTPY